MSCADTTNSAPIGSMVVDEEFPGTPGSLWRDGDGDLWITGEDGVVRLARTPTEVEQAQRAFGPMRRVVKRRVAGPPFERDETLEMLEADAPATPALAVVEYWHSYADAVSNGGQLRTWATLARVTGHILAAMNAEPADEAVDAAFELSVVLDRWQEHYGSGRLPMGEGSMPVPRLRLLASAPGAYARAAAELAMLREMLDKAEPVSPARKRLLATLAATNRGAAPLALRLLTTGLRHLRALEKAGVETVSVQAMLDMLDPGREVPGGTEAGNA